jgi:hypothetical protein
MSQPELELKPVLSSTNRPRAVHRFPLPLQSKTSICHSPAPELSSENKIKTSFCQETTVGQNKNEVETTEMHKGHGVRPKITSLNQCRLLHVHLRYRSKATTIPFILLQTILILNTFLLLFILPKTIFWYLQPIFLAMRTLCRQHPP